MGGLLLFLFVGCWSFCVLGFVHFEHPPLSMKILLCVFQYSWRSLVKFIRVFIHGIFLVKSENLCIILKTPCQNSSLVLIVDYVNNRTVS